MCVVYFSLPSFMGTLPSGVHFLPWVHPKRRKSKSKKVLYSFSYEQLVSSSSEEFLLCDAELSSKS